MDLPHSEEGNLMGVLVRVVSVGFESECEAAAAFKSSVIVGVGWPAGPVTVTAAWTVVVVVVIVSVAFLLLLLLLLCRCRLLILLQLGGRYVAQLLHMQHETILVLGDHYVIALQQTVVQLELILGSLGLLALVLLGCCRGE